MNTLRLMIWQVCIHHQLKSMYLERKIQQIISVSFLDHTSMNSFEPIKNPERGLREHHMIQVQYRKLKTQLISNRGN